MQDFGVKGGMGCQGWKASILLRVLVNEKDVIAGNTIRYLVRVCRGQME